MVGIPREVEVERVINLVQGFGWKKVKEEIVGNKLIITIEKELGRTPLEAAEETPT